MRKKGKYLGELLVGKGLITDEQLQAVIGEQMKNKKFLGAMLTEKGLISEQQLLEALAEQFDVDHMSLKNSEIDWTAAGGLSPSMITEHKCLPVRVEDDTIILAITNPLDVWVLEKAQKEVAPKKIKVVLVTASDMEEAIKEFRRRSLRNMMDRWRKD